MILTGDMIDGKTAFEWGLANKLVAPDQLMAETRKLAEKLASKSGFALRQCKAALRASYTMSESEGLSYEQSAFGLTFASADKTEGTKAFVEKRDPKWTHR